ncbi:MAG: WYL domain-containing protein [Roseburia sp.]|nr:WYL domain-containing protein [Roseburia sp.]
MYGTYDKKNLNLIIFMILWEHTDEDHRLQQQEIVQLVKTEYGIEIDRRSVKNNVEALKNIFFDTDYEISTDKGYCLLGREFTDAELRMLIDSVLFSKDISQKQAKELIKKIKSLSNKYFSAKVAHVCNLPDLQHADKKQQVLYNLDVIDDAIDKGKKISFIYNKYDTNFKLVPKRAGYTYVVTPYQMVAHNGHYYLICNFDKYSELAHLRVDKMTEVKILNEMAKSKKEIPEWDNGFRLSKYLSEHIYMYGGKSVGTIIKCQDTLMDELVDWFGKDFRVLSNNDGEITIRVVANEQAMFYWALQYGSCAEIIEPLDLREKIEDAVGKMARVYGK